MDYKDIVELFFKLGELKTIKRSGWIRHGIKNPESIADHSFRMAMIALILGDEFKLDTSKLIKMALIHDIAEIIVGDLTPYCNINIQEKSSQEYNAMKELLSYISKSSYYMDLWLEFERQETKEAKLVHNIDKLEMIIQAVEYENSQSYLNLSEFMNKNQLTDDLNIEFLYKSIISRRKRTEIDF